MEKPYNTQMTFGKISNCLNELADSKGIERCALMYALAKLLDDLMNGVRANEEAYEKKIQEIEDRPAEK